MATHEQGRGPAPLSAAVTAAVDPEQHVDRLPNEALPSRPAGPPECVPPDRRLRWLFRLEFVGGHSGDLQWFAGQIHARQHRRHELRQQALAPGPVWPSSSTLMYTTSAPLRPGP